MLPKVSSGESLVGQIIAGRYAVESLLGSGGAGIVYRAKDKIVNEDIAVKVMQENLERDPYEVERFRRELVTARKVSHPNVIRIHDMGPFGNAFFISMELLEGGSLGDLLRKGPVAIPRAIEIAIGVCDGLQAAHLQSVIHRDLKPDNVLFDLNGVPKLVDFGLARLSDSQTRTGGFTGTPFYMSPEQADGRDPSVRSDLYSLGVLLFELFTGRRPFVAESLVRLITLHLSEPPPALRSLRPEVPPQIEELVLRCLRKDPAARPASAGEVASTLRMLGFEATLQPASSASVSKAPATPLDRRIPRWPLYGAAVAALVLGALSLLLPRHDRGSTNATPATPTQTAIAIADVRDTPVPLATKTTPVGMPTRVAVRTTRTPAPTATPPIAIAVAVAPATLTVTAAGRVGLDVYLDGNKVGDIPLQPPIPVVPGLRVLSFRKSHGDPTDIGKQTFEAKSGGFYEFKAAWDTERNLQVERIK